jgi:uncharacterized repeat protein (TIGR02543 family)
MKKKRINYFKYFSLFFALAVLVFIAGCSGTPPAVPIINAFSASPTTITVGDSSTLSWSVTDATRVTIDNGIGRVALTGTTAVNPTTTTTYTLTATNVAGSVTATTTVTVSSAITITYNGHGHTAGTVPVDPSSPYQSGATVTVLGNTGDLTRLNDGGTSYRFTGWNTQADGSGADQAGGSTFTMGASPVTLYAQWTPYVLHDTGPAGGYIFYVKGGYSNGWRYLEAAPVFTEWTGIQWGSYGTLIGGTETGIEAGQSNTTIIVTWLNSNSETGRAAQLCNDLIVDGYSDWFLPSKGELNLMYENLKVFGVGGFIGDDYWSSSEYDAGIAWYQGFGDGGQGNSYKNKVYRVRAVRAF